jgi:hypothetical protein
VDACVGAELQLEAMGWKPPRRHRYNPSIVYEEVPFRLTIDTLGKSPHRSQILQVELLKMYFGRRELAPDALDRSAAFRLGAGGHNHFTPGPRRFQNRMPANPAARSGHNREFSGLGWNIRDSPWRFVHLVIDVFDI